MNKCSDWEWFLRLLAGGRCVLHDFRSNALFQFGKRSDFMAANRTTNQRVVGVIFA